jgi:glycosyltransferase involved in cell wall biosynthesis
VSMLDRGYGISILVPFRADDTERRRIWDWLQSYWEWHLPEAQLIVGEDHGWPFSKTQAVNRAARHASGDIFVILDADCWIDPEVIVKAAHKIRVARANHKRRWYVPYRHLWRLTKEASHEILEENPLWVPAPGDWTEIDANEDIENCDESGVGHHFGALIQIMPREAFFEVRGMDPRCRGWGVDDIAMLMALDTLYTRHRTLDNDVFTFYHRPRGRRHHRFWEGQEHEDPNGRLGERYSNASGDVGRMRALIDEWLEEEFQ